MNALINWLDVWFGQKAPKLPEKGKAFLVKVAPWLAIISIVFTAPAILTLMGISAPWGRFGVYGYGYAAGWWWIFPAAVIVLDILALPGLFKRTKSGWLFSFYAVLVSGLSSLFMGAIGSLIITLVIGFYILFQIRPFYSGVPMVPPAVTPRQ